MGIREGHSEYKTKERTGKTMTNLTVKAIKAVQTVEDLEALGIGRVYCDIGGRGGGVGFYSSDVANAIGVNEGDLPGKFGAGCNYLGGGVRGAIFASDFNKEVTGKPAQLLSALAQACVRVYENIENESGANDETYEDGDTNWDALATKGARKAGIKSAY